MTLPQKDGEVWIVHGPGARRIKEEEFDPRVHDLYEEHPTEEWSDAEDDDE